MITIIIKNNIHTINKVDIMKFYFIGIKGSGMSSLASLLKQDGNEVIGKDVEK